jgi:hypothetical protein
LAACSLLALGASAAAHAHGGYQTSGTCDGYPRINLHTAPGICVGLVAQHLGFPRGVASVGKDIYIVDNGDWVVGRGGSAEGIGPAQFDPGAA